MLQKTALAGVNAIVGMANVVAGDVNARTQSNNEYSDKAAIKEGAKGKKQIDFLKTYWGMVVRIGKHLMLNQSIH
ncbi:hypothetical protein ACG9ZL_05630 [Acinetobacter sp. ULE_I057]|uniref:hypothetical protein n=1 Tax=Acinetobacter sp. ULE_I057 TaxID=3373070 RepID=UPI003AF8296C